MSGGEAEEVIEDMPGVETTYIDSHEEWGETSLIAVEVLGAIALAGLVVGRRANSIPRWATLGCLAVAICAFAIAAWTAELGGLIHHPETHPGFRAPASDRASSP